MFLNLTSQVANAQILPPAYPVPAEDISRALDSSKLTVQLAFVSSCSSNTVTVKFPIGVSYIPGSVLKVNGSPSYVIAEQSITNLKSPEFALTGVTGAGSITFSLYRKVICGDSLNGKDTVQVTGSCGSVVENNGSVNSYRFRSPSLSISAPNPGFSVAKLSVFHRTTLLTNGGNGNTDTIHFFMRYLNNSIVSLSPTKEISVNGVKFLPVRTTGDTLFYKFFGDTLFGGDELLSNGEQLHIVEKVQILTCQPKTLFGAAWGVSENDICQWVTGVSNTIMDGGVPSLTSLKRSKVGYVDRCTPFDVEYAAVNGGNGNDTAAGMFNVKIEHGFVWPGRSFVQSYNGAIMSLTNGRINGNVISTFTNAGNKVFMDVADMFSSDPDGNGGLSDLDGDGYFDDLAAGDTLTYTMKLEWKCNLSCSYNKVHYAGARIHYTEMCGDTNASTPKFSERVVYESSFSGSAYAPANIRGGVPFRFQLNEGHYLNIFSDESPQTRYEWKFILPSGYSISGGGFPSYGSDTVTYSQNGDTVTIKSLDATLANAEIDLVYNCGTGSTQTIYYYLTKIDNDSTNCRCQGNLVCDQLTLTSYCSSPCSLGPTNSVPVVRRTNGSLGWTDNTLTTRQSDTAISAYDLARALYLDTIQITGKAYQKSTVSNLHLDLSLSKTSAGLSKLQPLDMEVNIKRGAITYTYTVASANDNSVGSTQIMHWDASSGISSLPGGTMLPGDSITTITRYVVANNAGLPQNDVQSGGRFYHYSYILGVREYCFAPVPEMYLIGTNALDGRNTFNTKGCDITNLGGSGSNIARRFNSAGNIFSNEFKPVFYVDSVIIKNPVGYDLVKVTNNIGGGTLTVDTIIGDEYTYRNPGTWRAVGLTRTNSYGARFIYGVRPQCNTPDTSVHGIKVFIKDFYYAHLGKSMYPTQHEYILGRGSGNTAASAGFKNQNVYFKSNEKPKLKIQNLSGEIKGTKASEFWDIEVRNDGLSSSGKTWLSVESPNGSTVTVDSVINLTTGLTVPMHTYGGTNGWFEFSNGLASAEKQVARVFFGFSNCSRDSAVIKAGWNCSEFPTPDPITNPNACAVTSLTAYVIPQRSQIQLTILKQPANGNSIDLCTLDSMEILVNSAQDGNVVNPVLQVFTPSGVFIFNPLRVEYPVGSGTYRNATPVLIPGGFEIDLSGSVGPGLNGIPGLLESGPAPGRQLRIVVYFLATCDHISGNPLTFKILGESPCGSRSIGDNQISSTDGIHINGASTTGAIAMGIQIPNDTIKCSQTSQTVTITNLPLLAPTKDGDKVTINLPQGARYKGNFNVIRNCPNCTVSSSPGAGGTTELVILLDSNLPANVPIEYSFDVGISDYGNCGSDIIKLRAQRQIPALSCLSRICTSSSVFIGEAEKSIYVARPEFDFMSYFVNMDELTYQSPYKYLYRGRVRNIAEIESGNIVTLKTFFDKNKNGLYNPGIDSFIKNLVISGPIAAGAYFDFADSFTNLAKPSPDRPLFSIIDSSSGNCLCNPLEVSTFLNALPIKLLTLNATNLDDYKASIDWQTHFELNSSYFEVYRSIDNIKFELVGVKNAVGNSQSVKNYNLTDDIESLRSGNIYYKLKQVDQNGSFEWSSTVYINKAVTKESVAVFPNPAQNEITIQVVNAPNGLESILIFDLNGKPVLQSEVNVKAHKASKSIVVSQLPSGVYSIVAFGQAVKLVIGN